MALMKLGATPRKYQKVLDYWFCPMTNRFLTNSLIQISVFDCVDLPSQSGAALAVGLRCPTWRLHFRGVFSSMRNAACAVSESRARVTDRSISSAGLPDPVPSSRPSLALIQARSRSYKTQKGLTAQEVHINTMAHGVCYDITNPMGHGVYTLAWLVALTESYNTTPW